MSELHLDVLHGGSGPFVAGTAFDLASVGYEQAEHTLSGSAQAYARTAAGLSVVEEAEFTTRLIAYRPSDPAAFNGTVVVEWLNVSGGLDAAPVWTFIHRELIRAGAAWVGVSAQRVGVHGGDSALDLATAALVDVDPERYGGLRHPGDRFSYDMYTRVAEAVRRGGGSVFPELDVQRVLAAGESQSAFRLTTYVNEVDELAQRYDGFLVHARGGTGSPLDDLGDPRRLREGSPTPFRTDLRVPVICVQSETDLITLDYRVARQADEDRLVVWEMAGTSHADMYTLLAGFTDDGLQPIEQLAAGWRPSSEVLGMRFDAAINAGPQHYVMNAAARALDTWTRDGTAPPPAARLQLAGDGFELDGDGNALGGIRTPHVDVPVATLSGLGNGGGPLAFLLGSTIPFSHDALAARYGTKAAFVDRFAEAARATVDAGFVLAEDLDEMVAIAAINVDL